MRFAYPSDILGAGVTVTSSTSVDADYPLTNLHDGKPTEVTRWTTNAQTRIVWDFGSARTLEGLMVVMHTLAAGAIVKAQAHTANVWTSPAFSQEITVGAWPDHLPPNLDADFRGTLLATTGYRYVSLLLPAATPNHALGEVLWVAEWQEVTIGGVSDRRLPRSDVRRVNVNSTAYGVTHVVERLVRQRRVRPLFQASDAADVDKLRRLAREAGGNLGFPVVIRLLGVSSLETIESLYVQFSPDAIGELEESFYFWHVQDIALDLLEVQRGLPL
jgi:hypothetical protein